MESKLRPDLPDGVVVANGMQNQTTSADRFMGRSTIWGRSGESRAPYMTRWWIGRLRLHIFHRGDADPDCHDHPWDFWTFPLTPYVEEVATYSAVRALADMRRMRERGLSHDQINDAVERGRKVGYASRLQVVPAWRFSFRPASHTHRVLGRYAGEVADLWAGSLGRVAKYPGTKPGRVITLVWRSTPTRKWGFLKNRDGVWCWVPWRDYVFHGGGGAPCE